MPFFWEGLLGLSLVVGSTANPRPDIPHGYTLVRSTDVGKSTTYEEIGFFSSPTTPGASATFVPKYDATVVSDKTLPFVTTTNDAGAPVTWIGDWNTDSAGSSNLVPVQVCSEVAQPLEGRSELIYGRNLVCSDVSAPTPSDTSTPVQTTIPKSPTMTSPTSTSTGTAVIPTSPSSKPSSPTNSPSKYTATSSVHTTQSTPSSPSSPTNSPTSSTSQGSSTESGSDSATTGSTITKPTSKSSGSSSVPGSTTPRASPSGTTSSSGTSTVESSSSSGSTTAPTQSTGDSATTTGESTDSTGSAASTTEGPSLTQSSTKDDKVGSTITSEPTGFAVSRVTNSDWTENFILTTTINGHETQAPVLVDCGDECGGDDDDDDDDGGIILFGVPIKTGIQYKLPKLPSFHFPCIFNCESGGGGGEPGNPESESGDDDGDDDDHSSTNSGDDHSATSSSDDKTTTSEATTSSSSCTSVMTASDCIVSCPATESCTQSCFSTVTGCDVTGTTSTATGDVCSFTNSEYHCRNHTATTQTAAIEEIATFTSVGYDTAIAESIEKAQETQPTTFSWGKGATSTPVTASPSPTASASTATRTSGSSTPTTATPTPASTSPTTFRTSTSSINTGCQITTTVVTTNGDTDTQTYCTCGNTMAELGTTTVTSGTMLVGCELSDWVMMSTLEPTTTIAPTTTSLDPTPTEDASCFPTHGENDIDKILEVVQPDGDYFCADSSRTLLDHSHPADPAGNNIISAGWTLADDAPEECQHFDDDASKILCTEPLNDIVSQCPWNGGSIKNVCGEFWMQTCTLGKTCDVGSPD